MGLQTNNRMDVRSGWPKAFSEPYKLYAQRTPLQESYAYELIFGTDA